MDNCGLIELIRQRFPNPKTLDEFRQYEDFLKEKLARCETRMAMDYFQDDFSYRTQKKAEKEGERLRAKATYLSYKLRKVKSQIEKLEWEDTIKRNLVDNKYVYSQDHDTKLLLGPQRTSDHEQTSVTLLSFRRLEEED